MHDDLNKRDWKRALGGALDTLSQPVVAVFISLLLGAVIILLAGEDVLATYKIMVNGAFGNMFYLSATLSRATPIIMGGLAVCIAWRSGYEAMGGEGQMILGALVSALIAYYLPAPGVVKIICAMLGAVVIGALYSLLSGWLYDKFSVTFIISTLMLNYIANNVASYLTNYVVKDPSALDLNSIQTGKIEAGAQLGKIFKGYNLHWGFVLAIVCVVIIYILLKKTSFGYKAKMGGLNPRFALYGGINSTRMLYLVLLLSGVVAGLGGAFEVLGSKYRYIDQMIFSTAYAWSGMVAALLANFDPAGTAIASILLAGLATGGSAMQRGTNIPVEAVNMIEGIITLLMSVKLLRLLSTRGSRKAVKQAAEASEGGEEQ
ncbi:MAG: ABC transporter permease [Clostridia bacterium]|nr:ABC transporter permease [Clostridia bacterium]